MSKKRNHQNPLPAQTRANRADVARRAGVSKTTVTYVLNPLPGVSISAATRECVLRATEELGYQPDFRASAMKRGRSELVGIVVPGNKARFSPFYSQMISGVLEAAAESDYHFLHLAIDREEKMKRCLARNTVDGLVVIQSSSRQEVLYELHHFGLPMVSINQLHELPFPGITMDYEAAITAAVGDLLDRGARHLLFVHGLWDNQPLQRCRAAWDRLADCQSAQAVFATMGLESYHLSTAQCGGLLAGPWDGIVMDGYELARDLCRQRELTGRRQRPMVVLSETPDATPLGDGVRILQSQPAETGRRAWQELGRLFAGGSSNDRIRIPYQDLSVNPIGGTP